MSLRIIESNEAAFSWTDMKRVREISKQSGAKIILVEGLHPMVTDPFETGHGAREWTKEQLMKSTYTAIGKGLNINHELALNPQFHHEVIDGEFNTVTNTAEYVVYESDPEILRLVKEGYIDKVSMQGDPRRVTRACDKCGTSECRCRQVPEGVIFGSEHNESMAYVVTKDGATYYGKAVPKAIPGDWNSSVKIIETNTSQNASGDNHTQMAAITREQLVEIAKKYPKHVKLAESIPNADKVLVKEDLNAFNEAMNNGNALEALMILGGEVYGKAKEQQAGECPSGEHMVDGKCMPMTETMKKMIAEALAPNIADIKSLKESFGNLSKQVQEASITKKPDPVKETIHQVTQSKPMSVEEARAIIHSHLQ